MPKKVLVVDDEEDYRVLVARVLKRAGYAVETAADGAEGIRQCESWKPDLVILDVQLPDMEGFEVCRVLRAKGLTMPVLFCTVRSAVATVAEGLQSGGDDYIVKPFDPKDMLRRIGQVLGGG
jgi:DNA-binding response OmpR family regulator